MAVYVVMGVLVVLVIVYAVSSVRASRAAKRAQGERDRLYRNCFLNGLAGILAKMVTADGRVEDAETAVAERLFRDMGLSEKDLKHCLAAFRDACGNALPGGYYASLFVPYSTVESRHLVYEVLWDIAAADGDFAPEEEKFLRELQAWLELEDGQFEKNRAAHARKFQKTSDAVKAASERLNRLFA